uniref:hypothetical protein n=1 Tax=Paractinoplanes polyasparticus TaxID=2856853 RepID=UPI001C8473D1|nr:hypothetical protein [Actinoplanes polyasparticus]
MNDPTTSKPLATGVVPTVRSGFIGLASTTVTVFAAAGAAHRRIHRMEIAPSELARRHWRWARIAATEGVGA